MLHNMLRAAAGRDRIPTDGLVAWYTMDNISGGTLVDEMGNYDGTISGATQVAGFIGQALSFDGNDYVASSFGLQSNTMTWSFWFKTTQTSTGLIISQESSVRTGEQRAIILNSSGIGFFSRDSGGGYKQTPVISGFQDGAWHLAIAAQDGVNLSLLIDDVSESTLVMPSEISPSSWKVDADIGRRRTSTALYYNGGVDQFRQYNRTLTSHEKTQLYNEGA